MRSGQALPDPGTQCRADGAPGPLLREGIDPDPIVRHLTQEALGVRKDLTLAHFVVGPRELRLFFGYLRYYLVFILAYVVLIGLTVFQMEKMLKEAGDKVSESDKQPLTRAIDRVKDAMKGTDTAALRSAISDLDAAAQAMSKFFAGGAAGGEPTGASPSGEAKKGGDDVIDAEYEVKK